MSALLKRKAYSKYSLTKADPEHLVQVIKCQSQQINTLEAKLRQFRKEQISDSQTLSDITQLCSKKLYGDSIYENKVLQTSFAEDRTRHFKQSRRAQLKHLFKEWALSTAIQGPREILESKTWTEFIVWTFFCMLMILSFTTNLSLILDDYANNEVLYSIHIERFNPDDYGFLYCPQFWLDISKVHKMVENNDLCVAHVYSHQDIITLYHLIDFAVQLLERGYNTEADTSGEQRRLFRNITNVESISFWYMGWMQNNLHNPTIDDLYNEVIGASSLGSWYRDLFITYYKRLERFVECRGFGNLGDMLISLAAALGPYDDTGNVTLTDNHTPVIRHNRVCHQILLRDSILYDPKRNSYRGHFHILHYNQSEWSGEIRATVLPYTGSYVVDTPQETVNAYDNEVIIKNDGPTFSYYVMQDIKVTELINNSDLPCRHTRRLVLPSEHTTIKCEHQCYSRSIIEAAESHGNHSNEDCKDKCSALPVRPFNVDHWNVSSMPCPSAAISKLGCYQTYNVDDLEKKLSDMATFTFIEQGNLLCAYYRNPFTKELDARRELCANECKAIPRSCREVNLKFERKGFERQNWRTYYNLEDYSRQDVNYTEHWIEIKFPAEITAIKHKSTHDLSDFFSNLGGITGFYLGSGLFAFVHLLVFAVLKCSKWLIMKRNIQKNSFT